MNYLCYCVTFASIWKLKNILQSNIYGTVEALEHETNNKSLKMDQINISFSITFLSNFQNFWFQYIAR